MSKKPEKTVTERLHDLFSAVCEDFRLEAESVLSDKAGSAGEDKKAKAGIARKVTVWKKKFHELLTQHSQMTLPGLAPEPTEVVAAPTSAEIVNDDTSEQGTPAESETAPAPAPPAVKRTMIELHIDTRAEGDELQNRVEDVEAILDQKAAEVVTDEQGATVYFEYTTIRNAAAAKTLLDAVGDLGYKLLIEVFDPAEGRLSEDELDRLDQAPRALVQYVHPESEGEITYCTKCVELEHVTPGEEPSTAAPGEDCSFCGWKPEGP